MAAEMTPKDIVLMSLVRPFTLNFTEPMVSRVESPIRRFGLTMLTVPFQQVFLLNLYIALIYGLLYIWFESFVIVFVEIYGFGLGEEGLAFLGEYPFIGPVTGVLVLNTSRYLRRSYGGHPAIFLLPVFHPGAKVRQGW